MPDAVNPRLEQATAVIHLDAIQANLQLAKQLAPGSQLLAMVKANAYGHGMAKVAGAINQHIDFFGVARIPEALELRENQCNKPIVVMSELLNSDKLQFMQQHSLIPVIYSDQQLAQIQSHAEKLQIPYWLKVDTGMHRLGLQQQTASALSNADHCTAIVTHFHSAEQSATNSTEQQLSLFQRQVDTHLSSTTTQSKSFSVANSATLLNDRDKASYHSWRQTLFNDKKFQHEIIRPGIMLYGNDPLQQKNIISARLQPAMTLMAPIIDLHQVDTGEGVGYNQRWRASKPSLLATVGIGYGDGYPRHTGDGLSIAINGLIAPIVGTVSMDMLSIDITELVDSGATIAIGDSVELWGRTISIDHVAQCTGTISYDLCTRISPRVVREYRTQ